MIYGSWNIVLLFILQCLDSGYKKILYFIFFPTYRISRRIVIFIDPSTRLYVCARIIIRNNIINARARTTRKIKRSTAAAIRKKWTKERMARGRKRNFIRIRIRLRCEGCKNYILYAPATFTVVSHAKIAVKVYTRIRVYTCCLYYRLGMYKIPVIYYFTRRDDYV